MARTQLRAGYDVVIPQYLGRLTFLHRLDHLAAETGVALREFLLFDSRQNSLRRWAAREAVTPTTGSPASRPGPESGLEQIGAMYDRLLALAELRPNVIVIPTVAGGITTAYHALLGHLNSPS
jgi:hypothetical protein